MTAKPTVFIVGADKGGVGKTVTARALLDYFTAHGIDYKAWDTEASLEKPGVLVHFFPNTTTIVDLEKSDGQMQVFDKLSKAYITVIDCQAGLLSKTLETLGDIGFLDAVREGKIDVVVLHVMGATKASFEEIKTASSKLVGSKHFLVTNHINNTEYWGWDSAEAKETLKLATGVIDIPKLDEMAMEAVGVQSTGFGEFTRNVEDNSFVLRGKVRHWLGKVFAEFNGVKLDPQ